MLKNIGKTRAELSAAGFGYIGTRLIVSAERILKLSIALVLLLFLVAPIGMMALRMLGADITTSLYDTTRDHLDSSNGIISGRKFKSISGYKENLRSVTSFRGEVEKSVKLLEIVVVDFATDQADEASQSGFHNLELDLVSSENTAIVVIARNPTRWTILPPRRSARALVGFESVGPVDIAKAPKGIVSGYRIKAFGASRVTKPEHFIDGSEPEFFCRSIQHWRKYYGVNSANTTVQAVQNPTRIAVSSYGVVTNGESVGELFSASEFCNT